MEFFLMSFDGDFFHVVMPTTDNKVISDETQLIARFT
jgi:hypothetical protein